VRTRTAARTRAASPSLAQEQAGGGVRACANKQRACSEGFACAHAAHASFAPLPLPPPSHRTPHATRAQDGASGKHTPGGGGRRAPFAAAWENSAGGRRLARRRNPNKPSPRSPNPFFACVRVRSVAPRAGMENEVRAQPGHGGAGGARPADRAPARRGRRRRRGARARMRRVDRRGCARVARCHVRRLLTRPRNVLCVRVLCACARRRRRMRLSPRRAPRRAARARR
jgi:hypothetical protein